MAWLILSIYVKSYQDLSLLLLIMIDSNSLLQTDATVIAGTLILLTIYSLKPVPKYGQTRSVRKALALLIVITIVPFSISAALILDQKYDDHLFATGAAQLGFIYIMIAMGVIVILPFITRTTEESP